MAAIRKSLFWGALACIYAAVLIESGSDKWIQSEDVSGKAISYLALFDGLLVWTLSMMGLSQLIDQSVHGRIQGILSVIFSIVLLVVSSFALLKVFAFLTGLIMLLLAAPFGTIAYMVGYASFPVAKAATTLSLIMSLKLGCLGLLLSSHPSFMKNKFILSFIGISIGLTFLTTFLHTFPPSFLVSIVDAIGSLVTAVVALIMALIILIGSIPGVLKAIR